VCAFWAEAAEAAPTAAQIENSVRARETRGIFTGWASYSTRKFRLSTDLEEARALLLVVVFLIVVVIIVIVVVGFRIVIGGFRRVRFLIVVVIVFGDHIHFDGTLLHDLEVGLTLETCQDLTLFDFVFVAINFSAAFRATDHDGISFLTAAAEPLGRIIYRRWLVCDAAKSRTGANSQPSPWWA
jgi:hypothetical protein